MPFKLFDVGKVPVTIDKMEHATETRKEKETRVVVLTCRVQIFDAKWASAFHTEVKRTLFSMNSSEPLKHIAKVNFNLGVPRQHVDFRATSDTEKASRRLEFCKVSNIYARTEKGTTGYALVFKLSFGPASDKELAYCESSLNTMKWLTFDESEENADLAEVPEQDEEDAGDDDQPQLPVPADEFDTDADGLPKGDPKAIVTLLAKAGANVSVDAAAAWSGSDFDAAAKWAREQIAANAEADPGTSTSIAWPEHVSAAHRNQEPARQRLHSHAGGKKKTAKASTDRGRAAKKTSRR